MSDPSDCDCELDYPEPTGEESWHYTRVCTLCGTEWGALHCPHDGVQNPCPACGWIAPGKRTPLQILGLPVVVDPDLSAGSFMFTDGDIDALVDRFEVDDDEDA